MLTLDAAFEHGFPLWFRIGMAEVLSNTVVRENELRFGLPIPWHIGTLQGGRVRLRELLEVTADSPYFKDGETRRRFDAQSWAVLHYLLFGRPSDSAGRVNDLAKLLLGGKPSVAAVEEVFGSLDTLESSYMRYTQQTMFQYARMKIDGTGSSKVSAAQPLPAHETAAARALFYVATRRPAEARTAIATARKVSPESPGSYEAEALLADVDRKLDEARAAYTKAADLKSSNGYVYYRLAVLNWGSSPDAETRDRIEALLRRSVALNDAYAPAYALLADAVAMGATPAAAVEFAIKGAQLAPGQSSTRLTLARVLLRNSRRDEARGHALAARQLADSEEERKEAQQLIDFIARNASK
jgi:hypothetical protein